MLLFKFILKGHTNEIFLEGLFLNGLLTPFLKAAFIWRSQHTLQRGVPALRVNLGAESQLYLKHSSNGWDALVRLIYHFKIISLPYLFNKPFSITALASHLQQPPPPLSRQSEGKGKVGGGGIYYSDLIHNRRGTGWLFTWLSLPSSQEADGEAQEDVQALQARLHRDWFCCRWW